MSKMKNILRDAGYCAVGAAAVVVEAGGKMVRCLVRKGEKTLQDNQDTVEDLKRRVKDLGDKARETIDKAAVRPEKHPVDASRLSPEERAELRRQLDEAEAVCRTDAACEADPACGTDVAAEHDEAESRPVAPDVIYYTDAPIPEASAEDDDPENSPNG